MNMKFRLGLATFAIGLALTTAATAQVRGITKDEIILGSVQDLSGPTSGFSKQSRDGLIMRVEEANAAGGINGRKIKLVIEDSGYDPKKGIIATQKMIERDNIFAMVSTMGTVVVVPSLPMLMERNVPNLFPLSGAAEMFEPTTKLKYAFLPPYLLQATTAVKYMTRDRGSKSFCIIYEDGDYGLEILRGAEAGLKELGQTFKEKTSYKRGSTDFSSQVARMRTSGCDTVVMGTIIRETIGTLNEAKKIGWTPKFIGVAGSYTDLIHKIGGPAMDGYLAVHQVGQPYPDDASAAVRDWVKRYQARFKEDPGVFSVYGYSMMQITLDAIAKLGNNITVDALNAQLEKTVVPRDMFGSPEYKFSAKTHLGNERSRVSEIKSGRWSAITEYLDY